MNDAVTDPVPDAAEVLAEFMEEWWRTSIEPAHEVVPVLLERLEAAGFQVSPASPDASLSPAPGGRLAEAVEALRSVRSQLFEDRWCYLCESEQHDPECPVLTLDAALARLSASPAPLPADEEP